MSAGVAIVVALIIAGLVTVLSIRWRSGKLSRRLDAREEVDVEDEIIKRYTSDEVDVRCAVALWVSIADCYSVSAGKLRLADRFSQELETGRVFAFDDENSAVNLLISRRISALGLKVDISSLNTIDDCIRVLCRPGRHT